MYFKMKLPRKFYNRPTLKVARDLLGCFLMRKEGKSVIGGIITETEAYIGEKDPACHAARGMTKRNKPMFGLPGFAYVYFIYGMYNCFNIVTERKNFPAAVLVRAIKPTIGLDIINKGLRKSGNKIIGENDLLSGPGKLCMGMDISRKLNAEDLLARKLWIEKRDSKISKIRIKKTARIGIKEGRDKLWRFVLVI